MGLPDRILGRTTTNPSTAVARVARSIDRVEEAVVLAEVKRWGDQEILRVDLAARARASELALGHDLTLYDKGMAAADGDPVKAELVLRYLNDQNNDNRTLINRRLGS